MAEASLANLKPYSKERPMTKERAKKVGALGGKKAQENAKRRKLMREIYEEFAGDIVSDDLAEALLAYSKGSKKKTLTVAESIVLAQIIAAQGGDTKAATFIRDTIGEKPVEKMIMADVDASVIDELEGLVYES